MTAQIEVRDVTFRYPGGDRAVLDKASLTVEKGEFVAILGGNGSGKSTLCKLLNGLIPHYYTGDFEGEVIVENMRTLDCKVAELSGIVGYVYQDFENQIVSPRVLDDACFAPLHQGMTDYLERGHEALRSVGLDHRQDDFIWQLSGGQKHLLALAGILSLNPDIIIIDEPVAQLDPKHAREIYDILRSLNEQGKTIIVIEHHTEFVAEYAQQVVLMDDGKVLFKKPVKEALNEVELLLERQIFPPQVTQAASLAGVDGPLPITPDEAAKHFSGGVRPLPSETGPARTGGGEELVVYRDTGFSVNTITREKRRILDDLNLTIRDGDHIALVGNNGAGKTSFMKLMTGLVKPDLGEVMVCGERTADRPPEYFAEKVAYIHQNPEQMFIDDSVEKDVGFFMKARKTPDLEVRVEELLRQFRLEELRERDSRLLSGGQQRRVSLAIGVGMIPEILVLDEPTANLDIATRKQITRLLDELKHQLKAVVIATHDMQLACEFANRIIVMNEGRIIHDGDRDSVFGNARLLEKAGLIPPQVFAFSQSIGWEPPAYTVDEFVRRFAGKEAEHGVYA
ncbi:cobalt ABC transporter ATP-binding protein [Bhargavaea cecembensis]|uniref:Cobalt ABC transporter ATP-binding protein n=1 Tax=Bhargavaea cecembensis TaxID=394098 RepID=A0A165GP09_9BACL|nr:energy-coupling factor transporter ATPase [Bhargavaea cecembensis]KZE37135.1 cobalt ABC transporter ATP-binding protein [Bhargavaea cecembensis]